MPSFLKNPFTEESSQNTQKTPIDDQLPEKLPNPCKRKIVQLTIKYRERDSI
ncbi:hypothetical protein SS50377_24477 [Spironucleus salmonicida]|uniref:Uncharacterized protein n=1 Tax=Spironucleus salmonicida TaxID=348837 RepID=A0A9P8RYX1_9EUKA|nr:hypothetical protein SS50377_24477 [Spironucleus salmonicida]